MLSNLLVGGLANRVLMGKIEFPGTNVNLTGISIFAPNLVEIEITIFWTEKERGSYSNLKLL